MTSHSSETTTKTSIRTDKKKSKALSKMASLKLCMVAWSILTRPVPKYADVLRNFEVAHDPISKSSAWDPKSGGNLILSVIPHLLIHLSRNRTRGDDFSSNEEKGLLSEAIFKRFGVCIVARAPMFSFSLKNHVEAKEIFAQRFSPTTTHRGVLTVIYIRGT